MHILFDLDDTLLDYRACEELALSRTFTVLSLDYYPDYLKQFRAVNQELWPAYQEGQISLEFIRENRPRIFLDRVGLHADPQSFHETYLNQLCATYFPNPGAEICLEKLSLQGHILHVASNGFSDVQRRRLSVSPLLKYIDRIFLSQEITYPKPHSGFFQAVLKDLATEPYHCLMVGDSLSSDIRGASQSGMYSCWLCPDKALRKVSEADLEIQSLEDLPDLLTTLLKK